MDDTIDSTSPMPSPMPIATLHRAADGASLTVAGWLRSKRDTKKVSFLALSDGSSAAVLQIVVEPHRLTEREHALLPRLTTGAALIVRGTLVKTPNRPQPHELQCAAITLCGSAPPTRYPLQKKEHTAEFLRTIPHLRPRTATHGAIARVRSALSHALHSFFHAEGFVHLHSPIITTHDAEGAGALFGVSAPTAHFFGTPAHLAVSGQLNAEAYALALTKTYTFGPTFRAEDSHTRRHLSEFWMVEPEIAFADLAALLPLAERCLKSVITACLADCHLDIDLLSAQNPALPATLDRLVSPSYHTIEYTEAIALLARASTFTHPTHWGTDLQTEHEKWLLAHFDNTPLFIINYPQPIKAIYLRQNDPRPEHPAPTVAAVDLIVPEVGELIGGSQREERPHLLLQRMRERGIDPRPYQWYLDLRHYGSAPHAGFGIGFDRLTQLLCGAANIRDVVAFPRSPGHALC